MTPSRNSLVLIFLLTVLQCFAPLLHAHTFGVGQGGGVHLFDVVGLHSDGLDTGRVQVLSAYGDDSPAIGMAQEYRQDSAMLLSDAAQPVLLQSPQVSSPCGFSLPASHGASPPGSCASHFIPFSQAPPAVLI